MKYIMLFCILFMQINHPQFLLDKKSYRYGQIIKLQVNGAQKLGKFGYINLEHYYEGHWYVLDNDINTTVLNAVSPERLSHNIRVSYNTSLVDKVRVGKAPTKLRFVLVYGPDFDNCKKEYNGTVFSFTQ